jgi:hypothetical protein
VTRGAREPADHHVLPFPYLAFAKNIVTNLSTTEAEELHEEKIHVFWASGQLKGDKGF